MAGKKTKRSIAEEGQSADWGMAVGSRYLFQMAFVESSNCSIDVACWQKGTTESPIRVEANSANQDTIAGLENVGQWSGLLTRELLEY